MAQPRRAPTGSPDDPAGGIDGSARPHEGTGPLPIAFVVLAAVTVAEVIRQGAFYPPDALTVVVASLVLIVVSTATGIDRPALRVTLSIGALAVWWLVSARRVGATGSFLPLGAGMLGFLAAFLVVRRLTPGLRPAAAQVLALIGAGTAAVGLWASVGRRAPLAMPAQGLWRLSTTLTYSDAAGLLLAMCLLVSVALDTGRRHVRIEIALCMAGLVATQSRGAFLAAVVGACFVPRSVLRSARWPLGAGLLAGLVVVGTSPGDARQPLAGLLAVVLVVAAGFRRRPDHRPRVSRRGAAVIVVVAVIGAVSVVVALHTPIQRRIALDSTADRVTEWHAAVDQWRSSPWLGVGPDQVLRFHAVDGTFARFAHDEYLQVLAGAGVVGELLLLAAVGTVAISVRREDDRSSCAVGALAAFAVAGALDFDWHLAALCLVGGWVAGLAGPAGPAANRRTG